MSKRIIVTGGCGFIGSHVVDELLNRGYEVTVVDNLSSCWMDEQVPTHAKFSRPQVTYNRFDMAEARWTLLEGIVDTEAVIHLSMRYPLEPERALITAAWSGYVFGAISLFNFLLNIRAPLKRFVSVGKVESVDSRGRMLPHLPPERALSAFLEYWHRPPEIGAYTVYFDEVCGERRLPEAGDPGPDVIPVEKVSTNLVDLADGTKKHQKASRLFPLFGEVK